MCRCLLCRSAPEATLITPQTTPWLLPFRRFACEVHQAESESVGLYSQRCFGASFRSESLPKAAGKWSEAKIHFWRFFATKRAAVPAIGQVDDGTVGYTGNIDCFFAAALDLSIPVLSNRICDWDFTPYAN